MIRLTVSVTVIWVDRYVRLVIGIVFIVTTVRVLPRLLDSKPTLERVPFPLAAILFHASRLVDYGIIVVEYVGGRSGYFQFNGLDIRGWVFGTFLAEIRNAVVIAPRVHGF